MLAKRFCTGAPPTKSHRKGANPTASSMARQARALPIVASILPRWRTMPGSASSRATSASPQPATACGSNPAKAARNDSRLRRMVIQASPAWNPSSTSFSHSARESRSGTPHSWSW